MRRQHDGIGPVIPPRLVARAARRRGRQRRPRRGQGDCSRHVCVLRAKLALTRHGERPAPGRLRGAVGVPNRCGPRRQVNLQRTRRVVDLDGRIAESQNRRIAESQNRRTAEPQNRRTEDPERGYYLAQRKPRSARRVRGSSAPRYEARAVSGRSCQEPPRTSWRSPRTSASHS